MLFFFFCNRSPFIFTVHWDLHISWSFFQPTGWGWPQVASLLKCWLLTPSLAFHWPWNPSTQRTPRLVTLGFHPHFGAVVRRVPWKVSWVKDNDDLFHEELRLIAMITFPRRIHFPAPFSYITLNSYYNTKAYSILNHGYCFSVLSLASLIASSIRTGTTASSFLYPR